MSNQTTTEKKTNRPVWVVPALAAVITWLVWTFGVEAVVFRPDITTTLLGFSVAANVGFVAYLASSRR